MKARDHVAFTGFLSEEAVFFTGPAPLHGKEAVAKGWKRFYEKPAAPFSWEPDEVEAGLRLQEAVAVPAASLPGGANAVNHPQAA